MTSLSVIVTFRRVGSKVKPMPKPLELDILTNTSSIQPCVGNTTYTACFVIAQSRVHSNVACQFSAMIILFNLFFLQGILVSRKSFCELAVSNDVNKRNRGAGSFSPFLLELGSNSRELLPGRNPYNQSGASNSWRYEYLCIL